jgi:hypothetical protein
MHCKKKHYGNYHNYSAAKCTHRLTRSTPESRRLHIHSILTENNLGMLGDSSLFNWSNFTYGRALPIFSRHYDIVHVRFGANIWPNVKVGNM